MRVLSHTRLARLMVLSDLSARQLARAAGWRSHTYLLRVLSGEVTTVTPPRAAAIAVALDVPVSALFAAEQPEHAEQPA